MTSCPLLSSCRLCSCNAHLKFLFFISHLNKPSFKQRLYCLNFLLLLLNADRNSKQISNFFTPTQANQYDANQTL